MIVRSYEGKRKQFKGVTFDVLATSNRSMITEMYYKTKDHVGFHRHPNEQCGYIISGKIRMRFDTYDEILETGDSYIIPENTDHSIDATEDTELIDFFGPPRKDYK